MLADDVRKSLSAALRDKRLDEAKQLIAAEMPRNPDSEELTYFQGVLFLEQGRKEEGLDNIRQALELAEERSNYNFAIAAAARLAALDPDDVDIRLRRADYYLNMGLDHAAYEYLLREFDFYRRRNNARALFFIVKKMITIDSENLDLALKMANILKHLKQIDEAKRVVENVIFTLQGQGKYDEAAKIQKEYEKLYEVE